MGDDRIYDKLDVLDMRLDAIDKTLVRQEATLAEHIRRTESLEKIVEMMREKMEPVQKHVAMVEGSFKFLGIISLSLSIIAAILNIFGVI
jgi:hypothetical protein